MALFHEWEVLYGYGDKSVRIWTTYGRGSRLFGSLDGWGVSLDRWGVSPMLRGTIGHVRVTVLYTSNKNLHRFVSIIQENQITTLPINVDSCLLNLKVQALDGPNRGFLFEGYGSTQAQRVPFGGAIYAYNKKGQIKVWRPNEDKTGYLVHIKKPYGDGKYSQASNAAAYHVTILCPEH